MSHIYRNACTFLLLFAVFASVPVNAQNWNDPYLWNTDNNDGVSKLNLSKFNDGSTDGIKAEFDLRNAP